MTERKLPDDRELEQYLKGDSPLSRRYRDASAGGSPPELDEAILAQARAELERKPPSLNRYLAPVALAASLLLGVNLAWNLYQVEPVPVEVQRLEKAAAPEFVPEPPPPAAGEPAPVASPPQVARRAPAAPPVKLEEKLAEKRAGEAAAAAVLRERELELAAAQAQTQTQTKDDAEAQARSESQRRQSLQAADAGAGAVASAPMTEAQKIDRLIAYIGQFSGAVFLRNGEEHSAEDAADHMRLKRGKAGERCDTAEEFIRVCASFSSRSGEAYLIRFPDGRTRTAEDVLREELARLEGK